MPEDVAGIFSARLSAATLERLPGELDDVERGTLFVAWPTPPRVGARVQIDLTFGEDAPRRLEALVVASRPARGPVGAGFKAALLAPHADLLHKLQDLTETARARIIAKAIGARPAPVSLAGEHGPIRERNRHQGERTPIPQTGLMVPRLRQLNAPAPAATPPPAPRKAGRAYEHDGIELPPDDGSSLEMEFADGPQAATVAPAASRRASTPAPAAPLSARAAAAQRSTSLALNEIDFGEEEEDEEESPFPASAPPAAPAFSFEGDLSADEDDPGEASPFDAAPPHPASPAFDLGELTDENDGTDLIALVPALPPPRPAPRMATPGPDARMLTPGQGARTLTPGPGARMPAQGPRMPLPSAPPQAYTPSPLTRPQTVSRPPPLRVLVNIANARTFQIHYQRFLSRGDVYCVHGSVPSAGTIVEVVLEIPDGEAPLEARALVERGIAPPEVPRAGFIATLIDPDGSHGERIETASLILGG